MVLRCGRQAGQTAASRGCADLFWGPARHHLAPLARAEAVGAGPGHEHVGQALHGLECECALSGLRSACGLGHHPSRTERELAIILGGDVGLSGGSGTGRLEGDRHVRPGTLQPVALSRDRAPGMAPDAAGALNDGFPGPRARSL
ncbi:MAG: hypothetical protein JO011_13955 [Ktedonobacteraceae bacterium]|nr:hypothetical protein [Ktedonobacteraceae bacterium]